jgi:ElaB/YqjD/DUF883 family membrane-anchored ribosome-binding protein
MKSRTEIPVHAQTPDELLNDLHTLVADAERLLGNSPNEHSHEALDSIRARFEAAQERLAQIYEGTKKRVVAGARYTDQKIRENPYQSMAIALGVGVLVGVLVGRRSK